MSKIRIKRIKRSADYEYNRLDTKYVNGTIHTFPEKGESLTVMFDKLGWGTWHTSPVTYVAVHKTLITLKTKNSTYHIKTGWKE